LPPRARFVAAFVSRVAILRDCGRLHVAVATRSFIVVTLPFAALPHALPFVAAFAFCTCLRCCRWIDSVTWCVYCRYGATRYVTVPFPPATARDCRLHALPFTLPRRVSYHACRVCYHAPRTLYLLPTPRCLRCLLIVLPIVALLPCFVHRAFDYVVLYLIGLRSYVRYWRSDVCVLIVTVRYVVLCRSINSTYYVTARLILHLNFTLPAHARSLLRLPYAFVLFVDFFGYRLRLPHAAVCLRYLPPLPPRLAASRCRAFLCPDSFGYAGDVSRLRCRRMAHVCLTRYVCTALFLHATTAHAFCVAF